MWWPELETAADEIARRQRIETLAAETAPGLYRPALVDALKRGDLEGAETALTRSRPRGWTAEDWERELARALKTAQPEDWTLAVAWAAAWVPRLVWWGQCLEEQETKGGNA